MINNVIVSHNFTSGMRAIMNAFGKNDKPFADMPIPND
jgi:hypothetical protein